MKRNLKLLIGLLCLAVLSGCTGAKSRIVAGHSDYPVSFSPAIRDTDGSILMEDQLTQVGDFAYGYKASRMFWKLIPLSRTEHDLSDEINRQVSASGGEGIVNLNIVEVQNWWTSFAAILTVGLFPTSHAVEIKGMIVKRMEKTP